MFKRKLKDLFIGVLIGCILTMSTPVLADTFLQKIDVVLNEVKVQVNGEKLDANTILYNGSTYLPMRKVAESVGKDVEWNQETMTANIKDKINEDSDDNMSELKINKDGQFSVGEKNNEIYYELGYIYKQIEQYGEFSWLWDKDINKLSFTKFVDKKEVVLIDNVEHEYANNILFVSKTYYETTILPLVKNN